MSTFSPFGIGILVFGIILIIFPDLIAYILGYVCVFIGINILFGSYISRGFGNKKPPSGNSGFSIG
jgi:cytochrome c biogenesis protein CcdA